LFAACGALRLARFNVQKNIIESSFFQGLPIPMAAGIVASSVLFFDDLNLDPIGSVPLLLMTALLAFVMVSNFRYRSFKDLDLKQRLPFSYLVLGVLLLTVVVLRHEIMIFALFLGYALLGAIFGVLRLGKPPKSIHGPTIAVIEEGDDLHEIGEEDNQELK
jgi:CDP-diacylglycerol--serine O-phosphatidyltransferase